MFAYVFETDGTPPVYEAERTEWMAPEDAANLAIEMIPHLTRRFWERRKLVTHHYLILPPAMEFSDLTRDQMVSL